MRSTPFSLTLTQPVCETLAAFVQPVWHWRAEIVGVS
jgi:hypothetical protein